MSLKFNISGDEVPEGDVTSSTEPEVDPAGSVPAGSLGNYFQEIESNAYAPDISTSSYSYGGRTAAGAVSNEDFNPGLGQPLKVGEYYGTQIGSVPIFSSGDITLPLAIREKRRDALAEAAAKRAAQAFKPFDVTLGRLKNPLLADSLSKVFLSESTRLMNEAIKLDPVHGIDMMRSGKAGRLSEEWRKMREDINLWSGQYDQLFSQATIAKAFEDKGYDLPYRQVMRDLIEGAEKVEKMVMDGKATEIAKSLEYLVGMGQMLDDIIGKVIPTVETSFIDGEGKEVKMSLTDALDYAAKSNDTELFGTLIRKHISGDQKDGIRGYLFGQYGRSLYDETKVEKDADGVPIPPPGKMLSIQQVERSLYGMYGVEERVNVEQVKDNADNITDIDINMPNEEKSDVGSWINQRTEKVFSATPDNPYEYSTGEYTMKSDGLTTVFTDANGNAKIVEFDDFDGFMEQMAILAGNDSALTGASTNNTTQAAISNMSTNPEYIAMYNQLVRQKKEFIESNFGTLPSTEQLTGMSGSSWLGQGNKGSFTVVYNETEKTKDGQQLIIRTNEDGQVTKIDASKAGGAPQYVVEFLTENKAPVPVTYRDIGTGKIVADYVTEIVRPTSDRKSELYGYWQIKTESGQLGAFVPSSKINSGKPGSVESEEMKQDGSFGTGMTFIVGLWYAPIRGENGLQTYITTTNIHNDLDKTYTGSGDFELAVDKRTAHGELWTNSKKQIDMINRVLSGNTNKTVASSSTTEYSSFGKEGVHYESRLYTDINYFRDVAKKIPDDYSLNELDPRFKSFVDTFIFDVFNAKQGNTGKYTNAGKEFSSRKEFEPLNGLNNYNEIEAGRLETVKRNFIAAMLKDQEYMDEIITKIGNSMSK